MYLKRLDLYGFKSFADKTRLVFEPGISAIIGPNGCGKSNIADSIRWCLGEQSARSMRSTQMLDVIFGGSQSRQTTGMAEVSLTFDNSLNVLPIDYSEVTVTRRLFRSGESEYFLNKAQCRLKDIRDLFLDTGIGAEGYAVIEQGKVEFLLTAKPEERRELFEEAAGVSKYKVRREETLRKLEKVDVDMNRVNDMLALLKEQIGSLDAAARKARQYQKCKDELRRLEIASLVGHIAQAQREVDRIGAALAPKKQQFEQQNTLLNQLEADLSGIRVLQVEKDERYVQLQNESSMIKSDINLADERIHQAGLRAAELTERREQLLRGIQTDEERIRRHDAELAGLKALGQELGDRVKALEQDYREKEAALAGLRENIAARQSEENAVKSRLFGIAGERADLHNEKNRLSSFQAHCRAQAASLQKALERLREQRAPLESAITEKGHAVEACNARTSEFDTRSSSLNEQVTGIERRQALLHERQTQLKEKLVSADSRRRTIREWEAKDPVRSTIRAINALAIPGVRGPLSSLIEAEPGTENMVAAALGDKLNYLLSDTLEGARQAVRHLEENRLGRATFLVLEQLPEEVAPPAASVPENARLLLSVLRFDPPLEKALRFLCGAAAIDGTAISGNALLQGGGDVTFDTPVLVEETLKTLDNECEATRQELAAAAGQYDDVRAQHSAALEERKTLEIERQKTLVQLEWLQKQLDTQRGELQYIDREIALNKNDLQARENEGRRVEENIGSAAGALERLDAEEREAKEQLQRREDEIRRLRDEEGALLPLLTEAKVAWATQSNELAGREREEQRLKESIESLTRQLEQARQELAATGTKIVEQETTQADESDKLRQLQRTLEEKDRDVQASLAERQELLRRMEEKNASLHDVRRQVEALKQDIHAAEMECRSFELQRRNTEQRLQEEYSQPFADVAPEYASAVVNEDDIARLKRRIESLGAVNLAAPEEYAQLEGRYTFLLTQQQDLFKAKEDLHQVIAKINHNTRENFKKTFEMVRENFRAIYRQLFEGGEADVILTDENNLLETGVDILAQPPGKKLQNIALLSGGEKALTAIALLFAFFMVKPSPFCILDEVDAPLDDANIGRYINMVKSFTARSQFLVITHNKRTMEMADVLYGVTMEELGVSKIISVRLNKEDLAATA